MTSKLRLVFLPLLRPLLWLTVFAALALCLLVDAGSARAEGARLHRFALLIGANDGGAERAKLRYAVSDAKSLARVLGHIGGVEGDDLVLLADPTRASLLDAFARLDVRVRSEREPGVRREVVLYYSGHSDDEGLLLGGERVAYAELRTRLQELPADVRVAILDSCSSGAFTRRKGGIKRAAFMVDSSSETRGHAFLTSSAAHEAAQESDRIAASFFTHFLVTGLRGAADVNRDRRVTLQEAYQFAAQETLARTERTRSGPQHAAYEFELAGTGDLVVTDVRATSSTLALAPDLGGRITVREAGGALVAELRKTPGHPVELGLEPGGYVVAMDGAGTLFEAKVTLAAGARAEVARLAFAPIGPLERTARRGDDPAAVAAAMPTEPMHSTPVHAGLVGEESRRVAVTGVSFGLLADRVAVLNGFQLALGLGIVDEALRGVQLSAAGAWARGDGKGAQIAAAVAWADGTFRGAQLAGSLSVVRGTGAGVQMAGGASWTQGSYRGLQIAGGLAFASDVMAGLQLAPVNIAEELHGAQVGVVNIGEDAGGLQFGVVNIATKVRGMQFGVVNVAEEADGESFGLLNFIGNGIHDVALTTTDVMATNLALKLGSRHLYTSILAAYHPGDELETAAGQPLRYGRGDRRFGYGFGLGWRFPVAWGRLSYLELEGSALNLRKDLGFDGDDLPLLTALRLTAGVRLASHLTLLVGAGANVAVAWSGRDADVGLGFLENVSRGNDATVRVYPGFVAGFAL